MLLLTYRVSLLLGFSLMDQHPTCYSLVIRSFRSYFSPNREKKQERIPGASLASSGTEANGHSFVHMEHEKAVLLLKSFQNTVDLVIQRELTV
ncbi:Leucine-rich repeat-containing protein 7 [Galemys pyrenaicus]|uniref:Leucine-rich repeat-containing protein 7 n=1 Tax=Galemys pyrenaicus TaxID=202257 RepID=A0A8J5ZUQ9_GALPY|nr:Leucine-rich repeat-containing protein 7 [Galemys pyrenaicus]